MKISFNTRTITLSELVTVRDILDQVETKINDELSGADRAYFAAREPVVEPNQEVTTMRYNVPVDVSFTTSVPEDSVEIVTPSSTVVKNIESIEGVPNVFKVEFEQPETHHHQGFYQSQGDKVAVPPVPVSPTANPKEPTTVSEGSMESVAVPSYLENFIHVSKDTSEKIYKELEQMERDELDSDGKPWDATIHSETRAKNKDGTWRNRRHTKGIEVKAAIPGLESITPNSVPAPPTLTLGYQPVAITNVIPPPPSGGSSVISSTPPPPASPPVVKTAPQGSPIGTFAELMEKVTKHFGAQKITSKDLAEVCATFGIASIQECFSQPGIIPLVGNAIDAKAGV